MSNNKQIVGGSGDPREDALNELFSNSGDDTLNIVDLPSKGKFYEGFQGVEIKPLTFLDEQKILSNRDPKSDVVSKLLEKSVEGVNIDELLSMDKMFLLMKVREVSYGDSYDFNITCPMCSSDIKTSLSLSNHLNMTQVPDDLEDPRKVKLPRLGVDAEVRFPRSKEEFFLTDADQIYKNMYRFVVSINGNQDPVFISKALKRMHLQDIKKLMAEINKAEYGVNPKFVFECPECTHEETMSIPMNVGFFSVS
jgi:hypothetical protein